jgi:hypothetical protein
VSRRSTPSTWDSPRARYIRPELTGADPPWVHHARGGRPTLLVQPCEPSTPMFDSFWNTSVTRVALVPGEPARNGAHRRYADSNELRD